MLLAVATCGLRPLAKFLTNLWQLRTRFGLHRGTALRRFEASLILIFGQLQSPLAICPAIFWFHWLCTGFE